MGERKVSYLGDSVYAEIENGMVKLTTNNGSGPSNTIYLEPRIIESFIDFVANSGLLPEEP